MNKENKKMAWALGLVAGLGILAVAYATLTSTLNINAGAEVNVGAGVEFRTGDNASSWYSVGDTAHGSYTGEDKTTNETAIALGNGGTLAVSTDPAVSTADNNKLTISDISLREYDAYVVYELNMENQGPTAMKITAVPTITFPNPEGNTGADQSTKLTGVLYTDAACTTALGVETISAANKNYIAPNNGTTTWYLKVSRNARTNQTTTDEPPVTTYEELSSGLFSVSIAPAWSSTATLS